jgi:glutamate decarboxylase
MSAEDFRDQIDENTIGVVGVVGTTFTGECDDVVGIDAMLTELKGKGLEVPMHIDAASGGFVFPFSHPDFEWDFRLDSVVSINASGHKFGLVYPGIGWLVTRTDAQVAEDLIFYEDYLGEKDATFTLNFSGSSSFVLAQYYQFIRLGHSGYSSVVRAMTKNREALADMLRAEDALEVFDDDRPTLPLLIAKTRDAEPFDSNDLVGELARRRGWMVPAYQMPPNNENDRIMRMLVKFNQTRELADALADDFSASIKYLRQRAAKKDVGPPTHTGHGY